MIKCEALENFYLKDFKKLKNIVRSSKSEEGRVFAKDIFECDDKMAKYLLNETKNPANRAFVKVIEITPEKEIQKVIDKEVKETKRPTIRKTRRKSIAKKG